MYTHACILIHKHAHTCKYTFTYTHSHMYTYRLIYTCMAHTHTHILTHFFSKKGSLYLVCSSHYLLSSGVRART